MGNLPSSLFMRLLLGIVIGMLIGALLTFTESRRSDSATPIKQGVFGDITATIEQRRPSDSNGNMTTRHILSIEKKGWPWFIVHKGLSGDVNELTLPVLGTDKLMASGLFQGNKMVEFGVAHDDGQKGSWGVFHLHYDQERNKWDEGVYVGGADEETSGLKEPFMDIDFDGQMDAASIMDPNYKVVSSKIYINGDWQKVDWVVPQDRKASSKVGDEKIHYVFEDGKGWRKSEDSNKPVLKGL